MLFFLTFIHQRILINSTLIAVIYNILKYIKIENSIAIIFRNITVIFDQINAALMSRRDFFNKHYNLTKKGDILWKQVLISYSILLCM